MHEQTGNKIVEKLTIQRSMEILNDKIKMDILNLEKKKGLLLWEILYVNWKFLIQPEQTIYLN
jgi:hypothetical protein